MSLIETATLHADETGSLASSARYHVDAGSIATTARGAHDAAPKTTPIGVADVRAPAGRDSFSLELRLRHAGARRVRIAYEWQGPEDAPLLLVAGGISAHRHVGACAQFPEPGWWPQQAGPGLALDSRRFRLLAIDWLGADGALDVAIDSADQADAIAAVLDRIGVRRAAAFIGCSYGAMVGLQFAARHSHRVGVLLAISGADCAHPYSSAWRSLQRRIAALGRSEGGCREALSLARQLAMLSYRTPEEFGERFATAGSLLDGSLRCAADDYLEACGAAYVARTSPIAFLRLSESIDLHAVDPATVAVPTVLVAVEEDRLVPRQSLVELAERLPSTRRLHLLRSPFGHDAFLKESTAIAGILRATLNDCLGGRP